MTNHSRTATQPPARLPTMAARPLSARQHDHDHMNDDTQPPDRTAAQPHNPLRAFVPAGLDARLDEIDELRWQCPHCDAWNTGRVIQASGIACPACLTPVDDAADTQVVTDASTPTPAAERCGVRFGSITEVVDDA